MLLLSNPHSSSSLVSKKKKLVEKLQILNLGMVLFKIFVMLAISESKKGILLLSKIANITKVLVKRIRLKTQLSIQCDEKAIKTDTFYWT